MRDLVTVINRMLDEIPATEDDLIAELKDNRSSASCSAPELMSVWWNEVYDTLCNYAFNENTYNTNNWTETVRQIFVGDI